MVNVPGSTERASCQSQATPTEPLAAPGTYGQGTAQTSHEVGCAVLRKSPAATPSSSQVIRRFGGDGSDGPEPHALFSILGNHDGRPCRDRWRAVEGDPILAQALGFTLDRSKAEKPQQQTRAAHVTESFHQHFALILSREGVNSNAVFLRWTTRRSGRDSHDTIDRALRDDLGCDSIGAAI